MKKQGLKFQDKGRGPQGSNQRRSEFEEEVISIDRISRMTSGGRRIRFRAVMAIGDQKDRLGNARDRYWPRVLVPLAPPDTKMRHRQGWFSRHRPYQRKTALWAMFPMMWCARYFLYSCMRNIHWMQPEEQLQKRWGAVHETGCKITRTRSLAPEPLARTGYPA